MKKMMIQITSGKGPAECCRVVACVQSLMMKQARQQGIALQVLENKAQLMEKQHSHWQEHNALERGNPVKTIKAELL